MATPRTLRPLVRNLAQQPITRHHQQQRTFLSNPFAQTSTSSPQYQTLTARRTLPFGSHPIYSIISDVSSYPSFLPYCQSSTVTRWSSPDPTYHRKWPSEDKMVVGFGQLTESFTSRVFCIPGKVIESVGGRTETSLDKRDITHHLESSAGVGTEAESGLLTHLRSRWTIEPLAKDNTEVTLSLEFAFANPLYSTLSAGAAPKIAEKMIKAFEERVISLLIRDPEMAKASLEQLDGSRVKR